MKRYAYLLAMFVLAGCTPTAGGFSPTTGAQAYAGMVPAKSSGPKYSIATVLPEVRPHSNSTTIYSLHVVSTIGRRKHVFVAEANPGGCPATTYNGFSGCEVIADSSATLKKGVFIFYSKPKAKGCQLAIATYKGPIAINGPVSLTFKPLNTKKCWQ